MLTKAIYADKLTEAEGLRDYMLINSRLLAKSNYIMTFAVVGHY